MTTYSTNLRLSLIGTGEEQGTWGNTTNTNFGTLLEQSITGYTSVTVTDGADTTLTTANGASDQARNMTINLVTAPGVPLTAARNVICPGTPKIYIVKNSTTGGYAVTFKVSGQTGVSIPNGSTVFVYVDGSDAQLMTQTPVPVAIGGTGVTSSTGTGSVVLSASPTLTGTPLISTNKIDAFPSGTRILFQQTAAPTGWTKDTSQNDKALRIVSGSVGTGGTTAFSSVFTSRTPAGTVGSTTSTGSVGSTTSTGTVGGTVLDISQIPSHSHSISYNENQDVNAGGSAYPVRDLATSGLTKTVTTTAAGSGGSHTHSLSMNAHNHSLSMNAHNHSFSGTAMDFSVQYVDVIIAQKD